MKLKAEPLISSAQSDLFAPILNSDAFMGSLLLVGRLLTIPIFVLQIMNTPHSSGLMYAAMAVQIEGIVLIALGLKTRFAALLLAVFCTSAALRFPGSAKYASLFTSHWDKNLAVLGLLLFMFAYGPGMLSLDSYLSRGKTGSTGEGLFSSILENSAVMGLLLLLGRMLSVVIFLHAGTNKVVRTAVMQAYMVKHNSHVPTKLIYLAILVQILCPILVVLGYKTRWGATLLGGFTIIAGTLFHNQYGDLGELSHFFLDLATTGGFMFMFAYGPGRFSVDKWRRL
jgi:putative oxidoreductase